MLEASSRVTQLALDQFALGGLKVEQLISGLTVGRSSGKSGFTDWNIMAQLFERAEEAVGGPDALRRLCAEQCRQALPEAVGIMSFAPDLARGAELINTYADSAFFSNVRYPVMRRRGARRVCVSLRIPERRGFRDSPAFFHAMAGSFSASSVFGGLAATVVDYRVESFAADFELTFPRLNHSAMQDDERRVAEALFSEWARQLRGLRTPMLELREAEARALESNAFAELASGVASAVAALEREALPAALVSAIRTHLKCGRVSIKLLSEQAPSTRVLATVGATTRPLISCAAPCGEAELVVSADVERSSAAGGALARLTPWLALVLAGEPSQAVTRVPDRASWSARLAELTTRWGLTARQTEVAWLAVQGHSNKDIASQLRCSERTVESHLHATLRKAHVSSRAALARLFYAET